MRFVLESRGSFPDNVAKRGAARRRSTGSGDDRIKDLLTTGWTLLEAGRYREASDAFGRVLLQNPELGEARRGFEAARLAVAEEARQLDAQIDEARRASKGGDRDAARALLEDVIRRGGDRDKARSLLDRLGDQGGRVEIAEALPAEAEERPVVAQAPRRTWSRPVFAAACALLFAVLAAGLAASWNRFVDTLVRPPAPRAQAFENGSAGASGTARGQAAP